MDLSEDQTQSLGKAQDFIKLDAADMHQAIMQEVRDAWSTKWTPDALRRGHHRMSKDSEISMNADPMDFSPRFPMFGRRWGSTSCKWPETALSSEKGPGADAPEKFTKTYGSERYAYDPVSNRMVPIQPSSATETHEFPRKVPFSTFKGYRSQFSNLQPPSLNPEENSHEPVIDPELPPQKEELDGYKPFKYHEPDGKSPEELAAAAQLIPPKEELERYKAFRYLEPDGRAPEKEDLVSKSLKEYDSRPKNWAEKLPVNDCETSFIGCLDHPESGELSQMLERSHKRRGDQVQSVIDPSFPFDADKYKTPYKYNEPDGQPPKMSEAAKARNAEFPEDVHKYQSSFMYNEPDGHPPETTDTVREALNEYDSKLPAPYAIRSDYVEEQDPAVIRELEMSMQEYRPDLDRIYNLQFDEKNFSALQRGERKFVSDYLWARRGFFGLGGKWLFYRHYRNAKGILQPYDMSYDYDGHLWIARKPEDLHLSEADNSAKQVDNSAHARNLSDDFPDDAYKYKWAFRYNEPDGHAPEKPDPISEGLKEYEQRSKGEEQKVVSRGGYPSDDYEREFETAEDIEDLDAYLKRLRDYSLSAKCESSLEHKPFIDEPLPTVQELRSYNAYRYQEPDGRAPETEEMRAAKLRDAEELEKYKPFFTYNEPDGQAPEEHDQDIEALKEFDRRSQGTWLAEEGFSSKEPEKLGELIAQNLRGGSVAMYKVTGSFVRDFPEEFNTKWSEIGSTLVPADEQAKFLENKVQQEENEYVAGLAKPETFARSGSSSARIQTSLDRSRVSAAAKIGNANADEIHKLQAETDPYSKVPQGLETSYAEEIAVQGEGDLSLFVSSYAKSSKDENRTDEHGEISALDPGQEVTQNLPASDPNVSQAPLPTLYKILAFEPSSQSIKIAETTSVTPDKSGPVTPPEALMRVSNPAKFFPHFRPLRKEGYEIVSGGGDVLVFKKVRPSGGSARFEDRSVTAEEQPFAGNSVDGVKPATGNFASPTGFVNHDLPSSSSKTSTTAATTTTTTTPSSTSPETATPLKFISNIRVRRDEEVFSGRRNWEEENEHGGKKSGKKGPGKMKRVLVGAVGLSGMCYATGVVAEWLRTGGVDGKGTGGRF